MARPALATPAADQSENGDVLLFGERVEVADRLVDGLGALGNGRLDHVPLEVLEFFAGVVTAHALRDQAPAEKRDEDHTDRGDEESHRCEVEHAVGRSECLLPEGRDDDVGWGSRSR